MKNNFGEKAYKLDNTEIFQGIPVFYKKKNFYEAKTDCLKTDYIEERKFELTIIYKCTPSPPPYSRKKNSIWFFLSRFHNAVLGILKLLFLKRI